MAQYCGKIPVKCIFDWLRDRIKRSGKHHMTGIGPIRSQNFSRSSEYSGGKWQVNVYTIMHVQDDAINGTLATE